MKLTTETAQVYKLKGEKDDKEPWAWAVIIIRSWEGGGSIDAQTDYGNYAYIWSSIGDRDIREFLCKLDYSYFMGKAHHTRGYVTDWDKTADEIKRLALEDRRADNLDAESARDIFDALDAIDRDEGFFWQARDYPALSKFLSRHEYPKRTVRDAQCNGFWNVIWPRICEVWKEELAAPAPSGAAPKGLEGGAA
jgi:hypothetical protein